jgi:hypothetical protein
LRAFIRSLLLGRRLRASLTVKTTGPVIWTSPTRATHDNLISMETERAQHSRRSVADAAPAPATRNARAMAE